MALGDVIARLAVSLSLETAAFEQGATIAEKRMAQSQKRFEAIGKKMSGIGKTMSLAITAPLVALGVKSAQAAAESRDALGQVTAALASMGDASGKTTDDLKKTARELQHLSTFDDDEILRKVTANMLTFGNVSGEAFDRAQLAAVNLSARLGQDLQTSTIAIGKALNEPVKGLAALRRVGIQFTEQQQEQIKAMVAVGDTAGAQAIMLGELERQFGGAAKAARDATPGADTIDAWREFQETIGEIVLKVLPKLTNILTKVLDLFNNLSPGMQTAVVAGLALAAALGPVLVAFGGLVQLAAPLLAFTRVVGGLALAQTSLAAGSGVLAAGFGSLAASAAAVALPLAAVAAAGYLIYKNWDKIAPVLQDLWQHIQETLGPPLQKIIADLGPPLKALWEGPFGEMLRAVIGTMERFRSAAASAFGQALISGITSAVTLIGAMLTTLAERIDFVVSVFDGRLARDAVQAVQRMVGGIRPWLDTLKGLLNAVINPVQAVQNAFARLYDAVVGHSYVPDMVDGIAAEMARLDAVMVAPVTKATTKAQQAFRDMAREARAIMERLFPEAAAQIRYQTERAALVGAGASEAAIRALANERDMARPGRPSFDWMNDVEPLTKGLDGLEESLDSLSRKGKETATRIAKSFKDMADQTLQSLSRLTNAIKGGGFLGILDAVIGLGLQLGSVGLFGKKISNRLNTTVPGYASGTNFHPGGLALVGERGPELVSMPRGSRVFSNDNSRGMMGGVTNNYYTLPSDEFWSRVDGRAVGVVVQTASAVARGGEARMAYRQTRTL